MTNAIHDRPRPTFDNVPQITPEARLRRLRETFRPRPIPVARDPDSVLDAAPVEDAEETVAICRFR